MVKFRWHRGGLAESMATMIEDTPERLREVISEKWPGSIKSEPYSGKDDRIGWKETHIVLVDGSPVGFTDGSINA